MINKDNKNIMLIGCGKHAMRIYVPLIQKFSNDKNFELKVVVDVEQNETIIRRYFKDKFLPKFLFLPKKDQKIKILNKKTIKQLNSFVLKYNISGVIIATEPLTHMVYAEWALKNNLSILMDKPISTHINISSNPKIANKIIKDYNKLVNLYMKAKIKNSKIVFSLLSQRRYHPVISKIKSLIDECYQKTNCHVTSIQSFHCDGQNRTPNEMVDEIYHSYNQGYGKCSHSGYHFFDIVPYILTTTNPKINNLEIFSNFVKPLDIMQQLPHSTYEKVYGKEKYRKYNKYSNKQLEIKMKNFGEVDAYNIINFKQDNSIISTASINLIHNGFSKRAWLSSHGKDLYKGNGRIRHETHIIEQGMFQCIHYHSYQSKQIGRKYGNELYTPGGEYHLELYVFKNTGVLGGKSFEQFNIKYFNGNILEGVSRGHQEDARAKCFIEFINALHNIIDSDNMKSDLLQHKLSTLISTGVHISGSTKYPVKMKIK